MTEPTLKPCPFCAVRPAWRTGGEYYAIVHAENCWITVTTGRRFEGITESGAANWEKRAEPQQ